MVGPCRLTWPHSTACPGLELLSCELLANPAAVAYVLVLNVHKTPLWALSRKEGMVQNSTVVRPLPSLWLGCIAFTFCDNLLKTCPPWGNFVCFKYITHKHKQFQTPLNFKKMLKVGGGGRGGSECYKVLKYIVFRRSFKLVGFGAFVNLTKGSVSRELETILSSVSWTSSSQILSQYVLSKWRNCPNCRLRETHSWNKNVVTLSLSCNLPIFVDVRSKLGSTNLINYQAARHSWNTSDKNVATFSS